MGLIDFLFNGDSRHNVKKLNKMAYRVEALEPKYSVMTNAQLREQTQVLKDRLKAGETLDDILYDAFAVVREAAWRVLKLKHYHVQIIGGIALHQGRIAEMKTGEGKTLVATLPSYLNALSGKGVHIVTVNDYLARRDAEWMGKVHRFLGLTVGVVVPGMDDDAKREAYNCDITYATNNELGFDYLRDNLKTDIRKMVQRELSFAIVDEVDSILIDEARTPLIISGKGDKSSELYERVDKFVRTLTGGFDDEGNKGEEDKDTKKKRKKAQEEEPEEEEESKYGDYDDIAKGAKYGDWDYVIDRKDRSVQITEKGAARAEQFFNIENLGDIDNAPLNHHIQQALKAHKLFHRDEDYIVNDGEVTALAGSMEMNANCVLGISMGTSVAGGYVNREGNITDWLNELAFVPVDYWEGAPADEWSGDLGCAVQYFCQQGVARLVPLAGIELPKDMKFAEQLKEVQKLMEAGDERAAKIYESIGVCFGYTIARYCEFYDMEKLLILGRVTTGKGGDIILAKAAEVLKAEFPELSGKVEFRIPDEKGRRHGQAVAAASLPVI